jgi:hypothetical protein
MAVPNGQSTRIRWGEHGFLRWILKTKQRNQVCAALGYVTGFVNQELLLQNEYLAAENDILKAHLQPGLGLSDGGRATLAEVGKRLGSKRIAASGTHRQTRYYSWLVSPTGR